jgi:hypothetical protein
VVALVHEAGHALTARPAGYRVTSFGVGMGAPLFRHRGRHGVVFTVNRWLFAGGACVAVPLGLTQDLRAVLFHAGGGLAQLLLGALLALLPEWWWVAPVQSFNLLVLGWNLLPWHFGGMASDGWWILKALRPRAQGPGLLFARRRPLHRIRAFEQRAGSPFGIWYADLMLAWMDLQVGCLDRADVFFSEDHDETAMDPSLDALFQALKADWHRRHDRPLAALTGVARLRSAQLPLGGEADGLLTLVEARALLDLEETAQARQALGRLAGATRVLAADAALVRLETALLDQEISEVASAVDQLLDPSHPAPLWPAEAVHALRHASVLLGEAGHPAVSRRLEHAAKHRAAVALAAATVDDRQALERRLHPPEPPTGTPFSPREGAAASRG